MLALPEGDLSEYDLMAGTGEVWPHLLAAHPGITAIKAVDISSGMYQRAIARLHTMGAHRIECIEDDVLQTALPTDSADFVIATFGLKTFNRTQQRALAASIAKVLKPGGSFALIEASDPKGWILRPLYLFHLKVVLPLVEKLFLNGAQDFSTIGEYTAKFGNTEAFTQDLRDHGLDAEFRRFFFGTATGACGTKSAPE